MQIPKVVATSLSGVMTDIFIILLENAQKLSQIHLWFDTGLDSDNSHRLINPNYLKNLIKQKPFQEPTLRLILIIYLHFTEKGKSGLCY